MKHLIRLRPSPAMVVACLALGLALGGTSYAAVKLPKNSVGAKQLKKNAVTSPKIKANAVTGAKVKSNAITGADVNESSLGKVPAAVAADTAALATTGHHGHHRHQRDHCRWRHSQAVLRRGPERWRGSNRAQPQRADLHPDLPGRCHDAAGQQQLRSGGSVPV